MSRRRAASAASAIAACGIALAARAETLRAGAQIVDCASALVVGVDRCPGSAPTPIAVAAANLDRRAELDLELEVDRFLAGYGKPSREVARALLDPSDAHVLAMLRAEEQRLAIAAYVGSRLTALRARHDAGSTATVDAASLPAMIRMRASLVTPPEDGDGRLAARQLERLAGVFGALDARVVWVGDLDPRAAAIEAAARAMTLPVRVVPAAADDAPTPYLLLQDQRYGLARRLPARGLTSEKIRAAIVALRERGRAR